MPLDDLFQTGTDAALADMVRRPRADPKPESPGAFTGLAAGAPRAFGAGVAKGEAFTADILGAFGSVAGAFPEALGVAPTAEQRKQADEARRKLIDAGPEYSSFAGDVLRRRAADLTPDPLTTGRVTQVVGGVADFIGQVGTGAVFAGPLAPAFVGGSTAFAESDKLRLEGVDLPTRARAGAVIGTVAGVSTVLPVVGGTAARTVGAIGLAGTTNVAGTAAAQTILQHAGYERIASQYDPFDPTLLALSYGVPAVIGGAVAAARAGRGTPAAKIPAPKTEADVRAAVTLSPAEQAASDAFERSAGNLRELDAAIKAEKNPANRAILEAERERLGSEQAAAVVEAHPEAVEAARVHQVAEALDSTRLVADADLAGRSAHVQALESATDMLARGERIDVIDQVAAHPFDPERIAELAGRVREIPIEEPPQPRAAAALPEPSAEIAKPRPAAEAPARAADAGGVREPGGATNAPEAAIHAEAVARVDPALTVHTDDGTRQPVHEYVARVTQEAAEDAKTASLVQAAVDCLLRNVD